MENGLDTYEWLSGLKVLSLDFTRPVFSELGLGIKYEETLRGLARDTLKGRHSEDQPRLLKSGSLDNRSDLYSVQVAPLLGLLERALGQKSRWQLEYWMRYIFCRENQNPWTLYEELLTTWAAIFRKTGKDDIGFSTDPVVIAAELRSFCDLEGPKELLSRQRKKFLTDWDFALFSELGLLEIPDSSEYFPFVDGILLAIGMRKFQDFWQWLLSFVGSEDLLAITVAAKKRAEGKDIAYCDPTKLPRRE